MSIILIICLILIGLVLIVLELLVFPGTTFAGMLGLGAMGYSVYSAFSTYGGTVGWIVLVAVLFLSMITLVVIFRSRTWRKLQLETALDGKVNREAEKVRVGQKGVALSRLAPMGTVELDGEFYEAQSVLSFVDPHSRIRVVKVEGSKIWVEEDRKKTGGDSAEDAIGKVDG